MADTKFVVLTSSRTGSSWLMDRLNLQDRVQAHGELFLDQRRLAPAMGGCADYPRYVEAQRVINRKTRMGVFQYLKGLYSAPGTVGFKLMYTHLRRNPSILLYMAIHGVRVVHLTRKNHLDALVSEELANLTGVSHITVSAKVETPKVHLDPSTLIHRLEARSARPKQVRAIVRLCGCPMLEVTYENLTDGDQEFLRLCKFLGISSPNIGIRSNLAKRGKRRHNEAILNYEDVRQVLSGTRYHGLLR